MTPKEKALELYSNYLEIMPSNLIFDLIHYLSKQCALIAVDEILNVIIGSYEYELENKYWQQVKQEIEKL